MVFSDSHCHLDTYSPAQLGEVLGQAKEKQVDIMVSVGMDLESSEAVINLAQSHDEVVAAVGIHPWNAVPPTDELRKQLTELASREGVAAISEIGLDYARNPKTKDIQKELLKFELSLALEKGLPVNVHCREAHQDMMQILRKEKGSGLQGNIHGFSGDLAELKDWLDLGFYVSIGKRFVNEEPTALTEVVRAIPLDCLLTETDATARGSAGPADVVSVAQGLASLKGATVAEIGNSATANLKSLLKL